MPKDEIIIVLSLKGTEYRIEAEILPEQSFIGTFDNLIANCRQNTFKQIIDDLRK